MLPVVALAFICQTNIQNKTNARRSYVHVIQSSGFVDLNKALIKSQVKFHLVYTGFESSRAALSIQLSQISGFYLLIYWLFIAVDN